MTFKQALAIWAIICLAILIGAGIGVSEDIYNFLSPPKGLRIITGK